MEQPFIQVFLDYCQLLGWSLEGHLTIYRHVNMMAYELEISVLLYHNYDLEQGA